MSDMDARRKFAASYAVVIQRAWILQGQNANLVPLLQFVKVKLIDLVVFQMRDEKVNRSLVFSTTCFFRNSLSNILKKKNCPIRN